MGNVRYFAHKDRPSDQQRLKNCDRYILDFRLSRIQNNDYKNS